MVWKIHPGRDVMFSNSPPRSEKSPFIDQLLENKGTFPFQTLGPFAVSYSAAVSLPGMVTFDVTGSAIFLTSGHLSKNVFRKSRVKSSAN